VRLASAIEQENERLSQIEQERLLLKEQKAELLAEFSKKKQRLRNEFEDEKQRLSKDLSMKTEVSFEIINNPQPSSIKSKSISPMRQNHRLKSSVPLDNTGALSNSQNLPKKTSQSPNARNISILKKQISPRDESIKKKVTVSQPSNSTSNDLNLSTSPEKVGAKGNDKSNIITKKVLMLHLQENPREALMKSTIK
jgi:hypothetical protein